MRQNLNIQCTTNAELRSENPEIKRVSSLEECLEHPQNKSLTFHRDPFDSKLPTSEKPNPTNPIFKEFLRDPKLSRNRRRSL